MTTGSIYVGINRCGTNKRLVRILGNKQQKLISVTLYNLLVGFELLTKLTRGLGSRVGNPGRTGFQPY